VTRKVIPIGDGETLRRATNRERLADLVYPLLRDSAPRLGIDLVRPPNPAHGDAGPRPRANVPGRLKRPNLTNLWYHNRSKQ
jgi:hypothetical protein